MDNQKFGHHKKAGNNQEFEMQKRTRLEAEIIHEHNAIKSKIIYVTITIILALVCSLFLPKSKTFYCDNIENFCELRTEAYIGYKTAKFICSPSDIAYVGVSDAKLRKGISSGNYDIYIETHNGAVSYIYKNYPKKSYLECHVNNIKHLLKKDQNFFSYELMTNGICNPIKEKKEEKRN